VRGAGGSAGITQWQGEVLAGSRLVVGGYTTASNFATALGTAAGTGVNGVLVAYSSIGTALWQRRFGGTSTSTILGVAAFTNGDIAVAGRFTDTCDFGGTSKTAVSPYDIFVARYAGATGALIWVTTFGSANSEQALAVAVDASDRVDITGFFSGSLTIDGTTMTSCCTSDLNVFVAQLNSSGVAQWAKTTVTDNANERGYAIAADPSGNVYVQGKFSGAANFGGGALTAQPAGGDDAFVWSLTSAGAFRWASKWGSIGGSDGTNGALVSDGTALYFVGTLGAANPVTDGNVTFGGSSLPAVGGSDVLVGRYNATTGAEVWGKRFGGTGNEYQGGIAILQDGRVAVGFTAESAALTVGGTSIPGNGSSDFVTVPLAAADGTVGVPKRFGGTSSDVMGALVNLGSDAVVTGYFYSNFTLAGANGSPLTASGSNGDGIIGRLTP
jgi:hypothetical protein